MTDNFESNSDQGVPAPIAGGVVYDPYDWVRQNTLNLLTTEELASALGLEAQTLVVWRAKREGPPYVKLGRSVFYRPEDVKDWAAGNVIFPGIVD